MSWERRGRRRYYFRARKVQGKVVKQYVGRGPKAETTAAEDARERAKREAIRCSAAEEQQRHEALEELVGNLSRQTEKMLNAALVAAGYYQHNRSEWRRRRG